MKTKLKGCAVHTVWIAFGEPENAEQLCQNLQEENLVSFRKYSKTIEFLGQINSRHSNRNKVIFEHLYSDHLKQSLKFLHSQHYYSIILRISTQGHICLFAECKLLLLNVNTCDKYTFSVIRIVHLHKETPNYETKNLFALCSCVFTLFFVVDSFS